MKQWFNAWLSDYQGHTTPRTVEVYRGLVDRYIIPVIDVVRLTALSPIHVRKVISEMQKKGYAAYATDAGKVAAEKLSKYFEGAHI